VKASGQTVDQFQTYLRGRLAKYVIDPKVNLTVTDYRSRPITVIGAVNKPGVLENTGTDTLAEVISAAGGLRPDAGNVIAITRHRDAGPLNLPNVHSDQSSEFVTGEVNLGAMLQGHDPALNLPVLPGDVVSVPRAQMVYVVGAVRHPTGFMLNERPSMTVMEAVSMAEGLDKTAEPKRGRILRAVGPDTRKEVAVNVNSILAGHSPDVALLPNDILVIPDSMVKRIASRSAEALIATVSGYVMLH
jgi:polysaccharide export outer membrane protein